MKKLANVKPLLKEGIPHETIARCIGLSLEKVQELAESL